MNLFRQILVGSVLVAGVAELGDAQTVGERAATDPHQWSLGFEGDAGYLPDALTTGCGWRTIPSVGGGVTLSFRPIRWLLVQGDTRASAKPPGEPCARAVVPAAGTSRTIEFPDNAPNLPLARSALRVGIETPPGQPLVRATIGGGAIWAGRATPFWSTTIGAGTRGDVARFVAQLEVSGTRVRVREVTTESSQLALAVVTTRSVALHPVWASVRLGLELPIGQEAMK